jgi:predicted glutamine amidotransferase
LCRLFGLIANKPVGIVFSFYESPEASMEELSHYNPHGWGVAWYSREGWRLYKEPRPLHSSSRARRVLEKYVVGRIIISHVRLATTGSLSPANTHPWIYHGWAFAHNGSILDRDALHELLDPEHRDLEGETDSEILLHLIVQEAERAGDPVEGIRRAVGLVLEERISFTSLNFVASDGRRLYAYRHARESLDYYTLYLIRRPWEGPELEYISPKTRQLIRSKLAGGEKAVLVASEPMSDEPRWTLIPDRTLVIVDEKLEASLVSST